MNAKIKEFEATILNKDEQISRLEEANSRLLTQVDDLKKKILSQDELIGQKDEANSRIWTTITRQTKIIEEIEKQNRDLHLEMEKFDQNKRELSILLSNFMQSVILMMENHMHNYDKTDSDTYTKNKVSTIMKHCIFLLTMYLLLHYMLMNTLDGKFNDLLKYYETKLKQNLTEDEYTLFINQKQKFMDAALETIQDKDKVHKKRFNELVHKLILPVYEPHLELIW